MRQHPATPPVIVVLAASAALVAGAGPAAAGFKEIVGGDFNGDGNVDIAGIDANDDLRL